MGSTTVQPTSTDSVTLRLAALRTVVAGAMLCGLLLSPRLWLSSRSYPLTPVWNFLPPISSPLDAACLLTLIALLLVLIAWPRREGSLVALPFARALHGAVLALVGVLCLGDQTRWQPWVYQYLLLLTALGLDPGPAPEHASRRADLLDTCRLVLVCTYLWSGLQKVNLSFVTGTYLWLLEPFLPESALRLAAAGGLVVPLVETALGLALLVPAYRPLAVGVAVGMHGFILLTLGPAGHNWNTIVWPWNVAMALFVVVLFWRTADVPARAILWPGRSLLHGVVLVLLGILPALSFVGRWDAYLSAALYSDNTVEGHLEVSETILPRLPPGVRRFTAPADEEGRYTIDLQSWAVSELGVPPYPALRVYRGIAGAFCVHAQNAADVRLVIQERPDWLSGAREKTVYDAGQLCPDRQLLPGPD